jgi:tetratricopeptide (TPR) repeat protein
MGFYNYKEEEQNKMTKKLHELLKKDSHEEIIKLYRKILKNEQTGEQTRCVVASLILLKKMDEARLLLDKWQDVGKEDEQWNIQYGWTYYLEQKYKEAIPYFNKVEDLHETETTMLGYLRECNEKIGNKEEIKRLKNRVMEINNHGRDGTKYKKENYYSCYAKGKEMI